MPLLSTQTKSATNNDFDNYPKLAKLLNKGKIAPYTHLRVNITGFKSTFKKFLLITV